VAALVGEPDAYAGELPVAYVELKPGMDAQPAELLKWAAARTPERAAVPTQLYLMDNIPLTAVGKVFKPKLRWDAAQRVFARSLAPLVEQGIRCEVNVVAHDTHGSLATVTIKDVPAESREAVAQRVHEGLDPFVMRHEIHWA